jgi:hypothetical protein
LNEPGAQDAIARAVAGLIQAVAEQQQETAARVSASEAQRELKASRQALEGLVQRFETQLAEEREQRLVLAGQLSGLATALDRLITHLQGLSQLMADLLEKMAEPPSAAPATVMAEAPFLPGGEGVTISLLGVPGFQALMDIQKALMSLEEVSGASVERFQEGESRILLQLRQPLTASAIAAALHRNAGHAASVEEARPELMRLRLKLV